MKKCSLFLLKIFPVLLAAILCASVCGDKAAASGHAMKGITKVSLSRESFNPIVGESVKVNVSVSAPGRIDLTITDRDGFPVRKISRTASSAGDYSIEFDGKDDSGAVLPVEAYTPRVSFSGASSSDSYDPAEHFRPVVENMTKAVHSRAYGTISYKLPRTSRVHLQVGTAIKDPKTGKPDGPVLRTVVDRKPRTAGTVIEQFDGFTSDGSIFIPDLPHFAIGILATSLPENSIIILGDESRKFTDYALAHRPESALKPRTWSDKSHSMHHEGLSCLEDVSPDLKLDVSGTWNPQKQGWTVKQGATLRVGPLDGKTFRYFLSQPTEISIYLDEKLLTKSAKPSNPFTTTLDLRTLPSGPHTLSANWDSAFGPSCVGAVRIITGE